VLVALAFLLYFVVRAQVVDRVDQATAHARDVVSIERGLGIDREAAWQAWALRSATVVRVANFVYFWLDFPLIMAVGLVLYGRRRRQYTFTRDAILFSGGVALISYNLFPVAQPRLLPESGLLDTLQHFNNLSYQAQSTQFFVNPYAAMPSLHVGWALLLALGVVLAFPGNRIIVALAVIHPLAQWASTVLTGNHYIVDGLGGLAAAACGLAFAVMMRRRGYGWLRERLGG